MTASSISGFDIRRLPVPSGLTTLSPNSEDFFGKGEQFFGSQTFLFQADLFQGDTSFRPVIGNFASRSST